MQEAAEQVADQQHRLDEVGDAERHLVGVALDQLVELEQPQQLRQSERPHQLERAQRRRVDA
eukprot:4119934-Prymnesium_polylepis.1